MDNTARRLLEIKRQIDHINKKGNRTFDVCIRCGKNWTRLWASACIPCLKKEREELKRLEEQENVPK